MARKRQAEEYRGRLVRVLRRIETKGGSVFPQGAVCKVTEVERGRLWLRMRNPDPENIFGPQYLVVRDIELWQVELLPRQGEES